MFDFGFWELAIIMAVALLVVGPERLPILAGQVGKWVGKARRIIDSIRSDIESEIKAAELKELLDKQQSEIGELKEILKSTQKDIESEFDEEEGDRELIRAVEKQIESTKQQQVQNQSESQKHESD